MIEGRPGETTVGDVLRRKVSELVSELRCVDDARPLRDPVASQLRRELFSALEVSRTNPALVSLVEAALQGAHVAERRLAVRHVDALADFAQLPCSKRSRIVYHRSRETDR